MGGLGGRCCSWTPAWFALPGQSAGGHPDHLQPTHHFSLALLTEAVQQWSAAEALTFTAWLLITHSEGQTFHRLQRQSWADLQTASLWVALWTPPTLPPSCPSLGLERSECLKAESRWIIWGSQAEHLLSGSTVSGRAAADLFTLRNATLIKGSRGPVERSPVCGRWRQLMDLMWETSLFLVQTSAVQWTELALYANASTSTNV